MSQLCLDKRQGRLDAEVVARFDAIGFVSDLEEYRWVQTKRALLVYKELHGNFLVPATFKVPTDDPRWPPELWSKKLGIVVHKLRDTKATLTPEKTQWLDDNAFVWDLASPDKDQLNSMGSVWNTLKDKWKLSCMGLQMFRDLYKYGEVKIHPEFKDPTWPSKLWNDTSITLARGDRKAPSKARRQEMQWTHSVLALQTFHAIHGHLRIPRNFVVPEGDPRWPRELSKFKLGRTANNIQQ